MLRNTEKFYTYIYMYKYERILEIFLTIRVRTLDGSRKFQGVQKGDFEKKKRKLGRVLFFIEQFCITK